MWGFATLLILAPLIVYGATISSLETPEKEVIEPLTLNEKILLYSTEYGVSVSLSKKIMSCESGLKPQALNLNYRNGTHWSSDYSYWQINDFHWESEMAKLGWDIKNPDDNLEAGFYLLSKYGTSLWKPSIHCWGE